MEPTTTISLVKPWRDGKRLAIPDSTDIETWKEAGRELARTKRRLTWEIIDWLAFGDRKWGVTYDWAAEMMDTHPQTLRNYVSIYNHAGFIMRDYKLGITFYQAVANEKLSDDDKRMLLDIADGKRPAREGDEPKRLTRDAFTAYVNSYMVNMGLKEPKKPRKLPAAKPPEEKLVIEAILVEPVAPVEDDTQDVFTEPPAEINIHDLGRGGIAILEAEIGKLQALVDSQRLVELDPENWKRVCAIVEASGGDMSRSDYVNGRLAYVFSDIDRKRKARRS